MNKTEFIAAVAEKEGLEKKTAEKAVNAVIACIGDALAAGDKIQIAGFGTFEVRDTPSKHIRIFTSFCKINKKNELYIYYYNQYSIT